MVEQVNRIVANALLRAESVALDGIGTLTAYTESAQTSNGAIVPPRRRVRFIAEMRGTRLSELVAREASVEAVRADEIVAQWRDSVLKNSVLTIAGVGTLRDKAWTTCAEFDARLNPVKLQTLRLRHRTPWLLYSLSAAAIAISCVSYWLAGTQSGRQWLDKLSAPVAAEQTALAVKPVVTIKADTVATAVNIADAADTTAVAVEQNVLAATSTAMPALNEMLQLQHSVSGRSYAVYGVYIQQENAEDAVRRLVASQPDLKCGIYGYSDRFMVAVADMSTRSECVDYAEQLKQNNALLKQLWVYTKK